MLEPTSLLEVMIDIFGVVIGGFAIGSAVYAWRTWCEHRRIEKHMGRG